jgi:hypothetical protein
MKYENVKLRTSSSSTADIDSSSPEDSFAEPLNSSFSGTAFVFGRLDFGLVDAFDANNLPSAVLRDGKEDSELRGLEAGSFCFFTGEGIERRRLRGETFLFGEDTSELRRL